MVNCIYNEKWGVCVVDREGKSNDLRCKYNKDTGTCRKNSDSVVKASPHREPMSSVVHNPETAVHTPVARSSTPRDPRPKEKERYRHSKCRLPLEKDTKFQVQNILDFLDENPDHIMLIYEDNFYCYRKSFLKGIDLQNILYMCKQDGKSKITNNDVIFNKPLVNCGIFYIDKLPKNSLIDYNTKT